MARLCPLGGICTDGPCAFTLAADVPTIRGEQGDAVKCVAGRVSLYHPVPGVSLAALPLAGPAPVEARLDALARPPRRVLKLI